jgi:hypothetical protein
MKYAVTACLTVDADNSNDALEAAGFFVQYWDEESCESLIQCGVQGRVSVRALRDQMQIGETA